MMQFLCDAWYDLFHLRENGYKDLMDWWTTRCVEFARLFGKRSRYDNTGT